MSACCRKGGCSICLKEPQTSPCPYEVTANMAVVVCKTVPWPYMMRADKKEARYM